ncbi:MAG: glycoside hydrolase [Pseudomonadota bacterium]
MLTRDAVVQAALKWEGVCYRHRGRDAAGLDCVGLIVAVARDLKIVSAEFDTTGYGRAPDGSLMRKMREAGLEPRPIVPLVPGAILVFAFPPRPAQHVGFVVSAEPGVILHAHDTRGVVRARLGASVSTAARPIRAFDFPKMSE